MLKVIRKGDKTFHGGSVLTASATMKFGGIGAARKGDKVSCPDHGNPNYLDEDGLPVAFEGHKCGCGCTLINSFSAAKVG